MVSDLAKTALAVIVLFTILIWEQSFDQKLFEKSLTVIPNIQAGASETKQNAWNNFSNVGLAVISSVPIIIPYIFISQRARSFYYLFVSLMIEAITAVAKLNYHEARPIWVSEDVQAFGCSN